MLKNTVLSSHDFCVWLQGVFDIMENKTLNAAQVALIREKLNSVFVHEIDPSFGPHKEVLQKIHNPSADTKFVNVPTTFSNSNGVTFGLNNSNQYDINTVRLMC